MNDINGLTIPENYLPNFIWQRDIQYFEGPLLSEYTTDTNDIYAFHWCDCSRDLQRWLAVRVSKRSMLELTSGLISIYDLIANRAQDSNLILLNINGEEEIVQPQLIKFEDLPEAYLPEQDAIINIELFEQDNRHVYSLLIDGDWESDELTIVQRRFNDVYSLLFQDNRQSRITEQKLLDVPWKGGFSTVNFYNMLKKTIGNAFGLKAIHYASPGYIEFDAERDISLKVKKNVDKYIANKTMIDDIYSNLSKYISEEGFNQMDEVNLSTDQERRLKQFSENLVNNFSDPSWAWFQRTSSNTFKSTQTARSYYRKIKELSNYVIDDRLLFSEI